MKKSKRISPIELVNKIEQLDSLGVLKGKSKERLTATSARLVNWIRKHKLACTKIKKYARKIQYELKRMGN